MASVISRPAVSPIGVGAFFPSWGLRVLRSELTWVWATCAAVAVAGMGLRRLLKVA